MSDPISNTDKWLAILISTLAGSATLIGGTVVFFVKKFKPMPYSACMALSAGVMTYITFCEVFQEAIHSCSEGLLEIYTEKGTYPADDIERMASANGYLLGTFLVFGGWFLADFVHWALTWAINACNLTSVARFDKNGVLLKANQLPISSSVAGRDASSSSDDSVVMKHATSDTVDVAHRGWFKNTFFPVLTGHDKLAQDLANEKFIQDQNKFLSVGIFTALILGIHNLPEGMGTFTGYLEDPSFGFSMAFGIGVHNIPEGISVAVPCYFGTGSAWKALALSGISAIAEPLGGFLAWAVLGNDPSAISFGILFGFITGIMGNVAIKELLFSALEYDPANRVTSKFFVLGMIIMAISLVVFAYVE